MKRCVIYTRKSVAFRLDIAYNTLESQEDICKRFIQQRRSEGWRYLRTYCDAGASGGSRDRAALKALQDAARCGEFDCVVVFKMDRLARKIRDFVCLLDELGECGVDVVSVTENFDFSGPMGKAQRVLLGVFAEWERENLRERCREWAESARMKGYYLGSLPPFGYVWENRLLKPEPERAEVVRELFRRYATGEGAHQLATDLNERRVAKRARGGKPAAPWHSSNVLGILHNPVYTGYIRCRGQLFEGVHVPLIDRDMWAQVQTRLAKNRGEMRSRLSKPGPGYTYALRGLLRCGVCGRLMRCMHSPGRKPAGRYYVCSTRHYGGKAGCHNPWLPADKVEALLCNYVENMPPRHKKLLYASCLPENGRAMKAAPTAEQLFHTLMTKAVYNGLTHTLELYLQLAPDGVPWGSPPDGIVRLLLPWKNKQGAGDTVKSAPSRQAVNMANALLLEELLAAGSYRSIQELANAVRLSKASVVRKLKLLNRPTEEIEQILLGER